MPGVPECTGACCAVFPVGGLTHAEATPTLFGRIDGGATIAAMLRPVELDEAAERIERYGLNLAFREYPHALFACNRWDEQTQRCMAYEARPTMCSQYPYDGACHHCGGRLETLR